MDNQQKKSLAIVFVLYRDYASFRRFLACQNCVHLSSVRFIIVDNTPRDDIDFVALEDFAKHSLVSVLVAEPDNLGYFGAAHFAMTKMPELCGFDFVAISNTDLLYDVAEVYRFLEQSYAEHEGLGAIAPRLVKSDGSPTNQLHYITRPTVRKYRRLAWIFSVYGLAVAHRILADFSRRFKFLTVDKELPREIFAPHGAFMIFTREYFQRTCGFQHPAFLFCEEITVGTECRKGGLKVIFEPRIVYSHEHHGSVGAIPSRQVVRFLRDAHEAVLPRLL